MQNTDPYTGVQSPADFLTQCMVEKATLAEWVGLAEHALIPMWSHGSLCIMDPSKACPGNSVRANALHRVFRSSKPQAKQGFALARMALGKDMFERRVTRVIGQGHMYREFAQEMGSFDACGSVADVQAVMLAFTDAGRLYQDYGAPEMQSKKGETYNSLAIYKQIQLLHYVAGYISGSLKLRRGTVVDLRGWMGDISSWGNLRLAVGRVADRKMFERSPEQFRRMLNSGIAEKLPDFEAEFRARQALDRKDTQSLVFPRVR